MKMNIARLTAQAARIHGDREALVNVERGRRYCARDLHLLSNRIVNMMRERLGLTRGDRYFCILENDNLSLLHTWTALKGEATAVWTNYRDKAEEHIFQIGFLKPKAVFIENELLDRYYPALREQDIAIICMDPPPAPRPGVRYFWDLLEGVSDADPGIESDIYTDTPLIRFTGGTTGRGKAAEYSIDNWLACGDAFFAMPEPLITRDTRALLMPPISHGAAMSLFATFMQGGCIITQNAPDLKTWRRNVEAERATHSVLIPTLLYRLLEMEEADKHDLSSLRILYYGAAPMSPSKLAELHDRFGRIFVQVYGSTECLLFASFLSRADHVINADGSPGKLASAGRITTCAEVRIVDDNGADVADGERGEIWIRSRATIRGYWGNPEATAQEFHDGFWKSGDIGYRDADGYLFLVDRKKDMIITCGFNVYAIEVENALNSHPAVVMSAVVGIPHDKWGEAVHAEVILKTGAKASAADLIDYVKSRLGSYKAPKSIAFVADLPITPAQKILRRAVRDKYWADRARRVG